MVMRNDIQLAAYNVVPKRMPDSGDKVSSLTTFQYCFHCSGGMLTEDFSGTNQQMGAFSATSIFGAAPEFGGAS
jgi:hypothetical protein